MRVSKRLAWLLAILVSFAMVAAACGGDDDDEGGDEPASQTDDGGAEEPADDGGEEPADDGGEEMMDLSGDIFISGSSTVEPVSVRVQELFNETYPDVNIAVDGPGTGDGFALFCAGDTDISDASRAIKDEEAATCAENGINYVELQVGIDGIGVMTNPANPVECVTFADIYGLVGPESTGVSTWAEANALSVELGGAGDMPDAELTIFGPGEESGTFDSFIEIVLEDFADERGQDATTRPDYNPSGDDNVILQGIQGNDTSFGWVGFAFAANAADVKLLQVDDGESGCVDATPETIASNEYPISRPLFIYVNTDKAAESEALSTFVDFYMADGLDQATAEVGYVALTEDAKASVRAAWDAGENMMEEEMDEGGDDGADEGAAPADLSGEIFISGSSTVEPISVRVQELFNETYPDVNIAVDGPGTGDGFALFCAGDTDISDASRAIKDEEAATCAENGIEFTEVQVGIDGIAVMTNPANPVECVTFADIYGLVGPESTGFGTWADGNALSVELGGAGDMPDAELTIFGPGEESGTFDSFIEIVLEDFADERGQDATTRPDYNPSGDDNVILQGIQGNDTSFGWVGFAFAANAADVKLLQVDDGESGCIAATPDTIATAEYPIARPLFIYVNNAKYAESPALQAFTDFYLADGLDQAVGEVGYVPLTDAAKADVRSAAEAGLG